MTLEEIKRLWPSWKIEFVCDYACTKLRNLLHINYVFIEQSDWNYWLQPDDGEYMISLKFENRATGNYTSFDFVDDLFVEDNLLFDEKSGANKMSDIRDKVILRIAWHLKEKWKKSK